MDVDWRGLKEVRCLQTKRHRISAHGGGYQSVQGRGVWGVGGVNRNAREHHFEE